MGKQRTSRPQAFKATVAATSEMKAHIGEKNSAGADFQKANATETQFAAGKLAELVDSYLEGGGGVKTSKLIPLNGFPSLKLPD